MPLALSLCAVLPDRRASATQRIGDALGPRVDLAPCVHRAAHEAPAASYIVRSAASGSRTIVNHNPLPEMTVAEFEDTMRPLGDAPMWFHFEASRARRGAARAVS